MRLALVLPLATALAAAAPVPKPTADPKRDEAAVRGGVRDDPGKPAGGHA